jgi:hypothetical protein
MGFLRSFNLKSWAECSRQMQVFDQRISAIEGVHGNYNPQADVNSGNITTTTNLTAPTMPTDAARYSDAMRTKTYSYYVGGGATGNIYVPLRLGGGAPGQNYWLGVGINQCYTAPCYLEFYRLWLFGEQATAVGLGGAWARAEIYGAGDTIAPSAKMASIHLWSRNFPLGGAWGTLTMQCIDRKVIPKGASLYFCTTIQGGLLNPPWWSLAFVADFKVIDQ